MENHKNNAAASVDPTSQPRSAVTRTARRLGNGNSVMDNHRELLNVLACVQRATSDCAKVPAEEKEGPRPAGDVYGEVPHCRGRGEHVPTHCSRTLAGSPAHLWVARSPVAFLVATPWWPPDRCAAGLDFLWGAEAREGRHLVSSGGLLLAGTGVDMCLEQCVERLNHERTTERHWQRMGSHRATVPKEVPCGSSTLAAAHATSPRAVAVRLSSVPFLGGGAPGWSGGLSLGPLAPRTACRRHRRIAPTAR